MPGRFYTVDAPRIAELVSWLGCNDVDPIDVLYPCGVMIGSSDGQTWWIRYEARKQERVIPLLNDPPMQWLKEVEATSAGGAEAASWGRRTI